MSAKHTPGPWTVKIIDSHYGSYRIMEAQKAERNWLFYNQEGAYSKETREANARLIAAAPELYNALVSLVEWARLDIIELQREGHTVSHLAKACDIAQAAINKARGEEKNETE